MLSGRNIHFDQPFIGQIAAADPVILLDIARDIGELESHAQVTGPIERLPIVGRHAHRDRHHAADHARDVIAIPIEVVLAARPPVLGIERESRDQVARVPGRQAGLGGDEAQRVERGIADPVACQRRFGHRGDPRQPLGRVGYLGPFMAMVLAIGEIVAAPTPGIEQPGAGAGHVAEQKAGGGEAF